MIGTHYLLVIIMKMKVMIMIGDPALIFKLTTLKGDKNYFSDTADPVR